MLLTWIRIKTQVLKERAAAAEKSALLVAQATRTAHEKTLRYGMFRLGVILFTVTMTATAQPQAVPRY